ncbi:MAG: acetoin utilization protein [Alphaproteobacteria bacterium]|nr:MAG: acetoin utilization protein [Alphaproteobacteria bacterium]
MTTRLYYHSSCLEHLNPPGHPERPDRLRAIDEALSDEKFHLLDRIEAPAADPTWFELVHPADYVKRIRAGVPEQGFARIDADTAMSPGSWEAALHAAGAAMAGVDAVFAGEADNVFAAIRPPGHHAERATAMGFCLINNIAVAARYAQQRHGAERIAIIDFDVHHGNGTQDIFWSDPSVLFASTHQMPLYPGTGALGETGVGNIFNAPLRQGDGGERFREAFTTRILPAVDGFRPDLILVSAGFDAHFRDPLAGLELTATDFDWATGRIMELAGRHCDNRVVSLLEGGYDLKGLADSVSAHVARLMAG